MFASPAKAQQDSLTLGDIYKNNSYQSEGFGPVRWMKDNNGYSTLERNDNVGGQNIVRYEAKTGSRSVLVSAKKLIPRGKDKPLSVSDYQWSNDDEKLLIFTNTRRVWRNKTRGDYWVLSLETGKLQRLGKSVERTTMKFAKFSPDGSRVAFVSNKNIYVEDLKTEETTQITRDGGDNIINGTTDWMYEEELGLRDAFRWSPDGTHIAYWQTNTAGVGVFKLINNVDSLYPTIYKRIKYPLVGSQIASVKVGVVSASGGESRWFDIPGDPRKHYLPRMDFIPHSNQVMIQQFNRQQNTNKVWVGDTQSMEIENILTEKDSAFIDIHDNIRWFKDEQYFTWTSERDGWRHLYKVSKDGEIVNKITKGDFDVIQINRIDLKGGYVYYIASPHNYTQRYLYRSPIDGGGKAERVTPSAMKGQSSYQISANAKWAIQTFQNVTTPPVISLVRLPDHKQLRTLVDNQELKNKYDKLELSPKEFFKVDIDDVTLDGWVIKPRDFDPSKKYPVLFYVYGEPFKSTVQDKWGGSRALWHQYMAQQGNIVINIDNRGTNTPRGKAWRNSIYGQIGILASQDQAKAARSIFKKFDFIDTSRVGIWGWSGGGSMTLNAMFRYPDIYKTGIAVAFVSNQRLYDAAYQERYMGLLKNNAQGYHDGSPINYAQNLQGDLMLIHGTGDDNVHYQSFQMLVNKLIKEDKVFSMMSYPMRSHCLCERENTSLHLRETMAKFWKENL